MTSKGTEAGGVPRPDDGLNSAATDDLVRRLQSGDDAAFDGLVGAFGGVVFNIAYRMTGKSEDADDLTQEVFVKLYRSIGQFGWKSKFSTWLYTLALNTCRSGLRKLTRVSRMEVVSLDDREDADGAPSAREPADPHDPPNRQMERVELQAEIQHVISGLPPEFREAVVLRDLQGLAYEEIADALQCSVGTVKSRLARGRMRVKTKLGEWKVGRSERWNVEGARDAEARM